MSGPHSRLDFQVAIICALPLEANAVLGLFDKHYKESTYLFGKAAGDPNSYSLGRIAQHDVVLATLPGMGTAPSASASASFRSSFTNIKIGFLVGICAAVPMVDPEIVLGDIVISRYLVQYDLGRQYDSGFRIKDELEDVLPRPNQEIRGILQQLRTDYYRKDLEKRANAHRTELLGRPEYAASRYPGPEKDRLYKADYLHRHHEPADCEVCLNFQKVDDEPCPDAMTKLSCEELGCEDDELVPRTRIERAKGQGPDGAKLSYSDIEDAQKPLIHLGPVATGSTVMRSSKYRDKIASKTKAIAFEMEGAGVWDIFPTIIIKGVCDYADSHKQKDWQLYAAASAASCLKSFLEEWRIADPPSGGRSSGKYHKLQAQEYFRTSDYRAQKGRNKKAEPSTGIWLVNHPKFTQWLQEDANNILWLSAGPGCGKSVLSRRMIDEELHLQNVSTGYFFFKRDGDDKQDQASTALCAILHQLFTIRNDLLYLAVPVISANGPNIKTLFDDLWDLLMEVSRMWKENTLICVLDGFDECCDVDQNRLLDKLSYYTRAKKREAPCLKFFITSRNYVLTQRKLKVDIPIIEISGDDEIESISREINLVISSNMVKIKAELDLSENAIEAILEKLYSIPNRTYLWVTLVLAEIRRTFKKSAKSLIALIDQLPASVSAAYEALLKRIVDREEAMLVMRIVLTAQRPLSVKELDVALSIEPDSDTYDSLDLQGESARKEYIQYVCELFVTISEGKVYFIHETAKVFLLNRQQDKRPENERGWLHSIDLRESHRILARTCITHLLFKDLHRNSITTNLIANFKNPRISTWSPQDIIPGSMEQLFIENCHLSNPCDSTEIGDTSTSLEPNLSCKCEETEPSLAKENDSFKRHRKIKSFIESYILNHDFIGYSAVYWHVHVNEGGFAATDSINEDILRLYDSKGKALSTWFSIYWASCPQRQYPHFTPLEIALSFHHENIVLNSIGNEALLQASPCFARQPIHWATMKRESGILNLLLEYGADIEAMDTAQRTPLHLAVIAYQDNVLKVELLLKRGASVHAKDYFGLTPLHLVENNKALAELLITYGADLDCQDITGRTPIEMAAAQNSMDVARLLLQKGAQLTEQAMYQAAFHNSKDVINLFDAKKAKVSQSVKVKNLKMAETAKPLLDAVVRGSLEDLIMCLKRGIHLDTSDENKFSALHHAAMLDRLHIIIYLMWNGAATNATNIDLDTPLHIAAVTGNTAAAYCLLYPHAVYSQIITLYEAGTEFQRIQLKILQRELEGSQGDSITLPHLEMRDVHGYTPLALALKEGHIKTVEFLLSVGANINCRLVGGFGILFDPVINSNMAMVELLITKGVDLNIKSNSGFTALFLAVQSDNLCIAELLLRNGADHSIKTSTAPQIPPIFEAIWHKNMKMIVLLIAYGASLSVLDGNGRSVLHWAIMANCEIEFFEFLLAKGADVQQQDVAEKFALDYADEANPPDTVALLAEVTEKKSKVWLEIKSEAAIFASKILKAVDAIHHKMQVCGKRLLDQLVLPSSQGIHSILSPESATLSHSQVWGFTQAEFQTPEIIETLEECAAVSRHLAALLKRGTIDKSQTSNRFVELIQENIINFGLVTDHEKLGPTSFDKENAVLLLLKLARFMSHENSELISPDRNALTDEIIVQLISVLLGKNIKSDLHTLREEMETLDTRPMSYLLQEEVFKQDRIRHNKAVRWITSDLRFQDVEVEDGYTNIDMMRWEEENFTGNDARRLFHKFVTSEGLIVKVTSDYMTLSEPNEGYRSRYIALREE